jgi:tetratricopeptide (TPR) repeat protein
LLAGHSNHLGNQGFNHHHLNGNHQQFHGNGNNGNWNHSNWNLGNNHKNYHYNYYGGGWGGLGFGLGYGLGWGWPGYDGGYGLSYSNDYYGLGSYGYGLGGYGYGLSGLRHGYGLNNSYLNYGCVSYQPCCADQFLNLGYVGIIPYATDNTAFGIGFDAIAYAPQSQLTALGIATATDAPPPVVPSTNPPAAEFDKTSGAASGLPTAEEFAQIGEAAFKSRDYKGAVRAWKHGLVDDPQNSVLVLMLSQGLFATEQFRESAGAIQAAMQTLPQEKWDVVVKNFRDLYGKGEDYTAQVRSLEKAAREKSDDPALRFLLGYHYGFLGYPAEAVKQLEKCVKLAPQDESARKLLRVFEEKLPKPKETPGPSNPPATAAADDKSSVANPATEDFVPPPPLSPEPSAPAAGAPK